MKYETIRYEIDAGVALITLDRPRRLNAMNGEMLGEISDALDDAETNDDVRVVVLAGNGAGFCSGFDLKEELEEIKPETAADWEPAIMGGYSIISRFWTLKKPTISAVHGFALAGGCELALCCDLTIASEDSYFGEPEIRFGAGIVVLILPWLTHPKKAKEMIFTGNDRISAKDAESIGLVNTLTPEGGHLTEAMSVARNLAKMDPAPLQGMKAAINRTYDRMGMAESLRMGAEVDLVLESVGNPVRREFARVVAEKGLKAGVEWREAQFGDD